METVELIRLGCYATNATTSFILAVYFLRDFARKRLRASLAWGLGFAFFGVAMVPMAAIATIEITKPAMAIGVVISSLEVLFLYYGASLLFFREGSFFREKFAVIYFLATIVVGELFVMYTPIEKVAERLAPGVTAIIAIVYIACAILFFQVSRRLPKDDPRRRTITLVSLGWVFIVLWAFYIAVFWLRAPASADAALFLLGSVGFVLVLYGMITGKATRR
ncbi:MAG: hypothetical protein HXS46_14000 [Theionarchaea archaeon]|nr:MAG: hypothetical protein AYK18_08495 [Theionarchaea archaeon DG-70]MBU7011796.1 hypothetical protein [Theionarchaea archaeon]